MALYNQFVPFDETYCLTRKKIRLINFISFNFQSCRYCKHVGVVEVCMYVSYVYIGGRKPGLSLIKRLYTLGNYRYLLILHNMHLHVFV